MLLLVSCTADRSNLIEEKNVFYIDGEKKELERGLAMDYSNTSGQGPYRIDLTMLTDGFTINEDGELIGEGNGIQFRLYSSLAFQLKPGRYSFNSSGGEFTFDQGSVFYDDFGDRDSVLLIGGTLEITKSSKDLYELSFNCTDVQGREISGYFYKSFYYTLQAGN